MGLVKIVIFDESLKMVISVGFDKGAVLEGDLP